MSHEHAKIIDDDCDGVLDEGIFPRGGERLYPSTSATMIDAIRRPMRAQANLYRRGTKSRTELGTAGLISRLHPFGSGP